MSTDDAPQPGPERVAQFVVARMRELIGDGASIGRRARTLSPLSAIYECTALGRAKVRAGGVTRAAAEPAKAGHNIATLPEVIREATSLLRADPILKRTQPELVPLVCDDLERLAHQDVLEATILRIEAYGEGLRRTYLSDAFSTLEQLAAEGKEFFALEDACHTLVAELRARGWSDASLAERLAGEILDVPALVEILKTFDVPIRGWKCFVAITATTHRAAFQIPLRLDLTDALPAGPVLGPPPPRNGPFAVLNISAVDHRYAAESAHSQASSILGAAAVFVKTDLLVRSSTVVVETPEGLRSFDAHLRLPRESRHTKAEQLRRIVRSAADAASTQTTDSIFDAIRHRQRAVEATDLESRYMLLWLGIERLCLGSPDHSAILESVRALVPPAIALGKLRRNLAAFRNYLSRRAHQHGGKEIRTPDKLLDLIRDNDRRILTAEFYDADPLATQWVARLQRDLSTTDGTKLVGRSS